MSTTQEFPFLTAPPTINCHVGEIRHFTLKTNFKSLKMLFQETEHDTQTTLGVLSGMLFRKNGKNQKKQSVQLFCLQNQ